MRTTIPKLLFALTLAASLPACVAAAAAAGAGAGIYLTNQGAESLINAPIDEVADRARTVMQQRNIRPTGTQTDLEAEQRELSGEMGEYDVTIELEAQSDTTTRAEVTVQENAVQYDKDMARDILEQIVSM